MQDRTKSITEDQIENYQPPVPKPKKRQNKEKSKLNIELIVDPQRQQTSLLNIKTGELYSGNEEAEERSQSDRRSTNPTTMTISCNATDCNDSILGDKDGDNPSHLAEYQQHDNFLVPLPKTNKPKINRTTLISQIAKEWKALPEAERKKYKIKAKMHMEKYKKDKKDKLIQMMQKAIGEFTVPHLLRQQKRRERSCQKTQIVV
jgi:HMG (high mobility group) box